MANPLAPVTTLTQLYDLDTVTELFIRDTLAADAEIVAGIGKNSASGVVQVYPTIADQEGASHPLCLYNSQTNGSFVVKGLGRAVVLAEGIWRVRFEGRQEQALDLARLNARAVLVLASRGQRETKYGRIVECTVEGTFHGAPERQEGGEVLLQKGTDYRIKTQRL